MSFAQGLESYTEIPADVLLPVEKEKGPAAKKKAAAAARARALTRNSRLALVAQQQASPSSDAPTVAAEAAFASNGMSYTPCFPASLPSCLHLNPPESDHGCVAGYHNLTGRYSFGNNVGSFEKSANRGFNTYVLYT